MASVLAVIDDLFFLAKVRETARQIGVPLETAQASGPVLEAARTKRPPLVLVDLGCRSADPVTVIRNLKGDEATRDIPIVGFGSHVETDRLEQALAAGADRVMARSGFVRELPSLLEEFGPPPSAEGK